MIPHSRRRNYNFTVFVNKHPLLIYGFIIIVTCNKTSPSIFILAKLRYIGIFAFDNFIAIYIYCAKFVKKQKVLFSIFVFITIEQPKLIRNIRV